jgi:hypothetical protein
LKKTAQKAEVKVKVDNTNGEDTIMVVATDEVQVRGRGREIQELGVDELANNVNRFLAQMQAVLGQTPQVVGDFQFAEFEVTAEISASGGLSLLGTGVEVGATGGLTFRFQRANAQ